MGSSVKSKFIENLLKESNTFLDGFSNTLKILITKFGEGDGFFHHRIDNPVMEKTLEHNFKKLVKKDNNRFEDNYLYSFGDNYGEDALKYVIRHNIPMEDVVTFMFLDSKGGRKLSDVLVKFDEKEQIKFLDDRGSSLNNYVQWELWAK